MPAYCVRCHSYVADMAIHYQLYHGPQNLASKKIVLSTTYGIYRRQ